MKVVVAAFNQEKALVGARDCETDGSFHSTSYLLPIVTPGTRDMVIVSDCNCACRGGDSRVTRDRLLSISFISFRVTFYVHFDCTNIQLSIIFYINCSLQMNSHNH